MHAELLNISSSSPSSDAGHHDAEKKQADLPATGDRRTETVEGKEFFRAVRLGSHRNIKSHGICHTVFIRYTGQTPGFTERWRRNILESPSEIQQF